MFTTFTNDLTVTSFIALCAFGLAVFVLIASIFAKDARTLVLKIFASLLIITLSLLANNWAVYLAAVFITATLITELNFLENIAAIITNREWWKIEKATKEEIKEKAKNELPKTQQTQQTIQQTVVEENKILKKLADSQLFDKKNFQIGLALESPPGDKFIFDALASTSTTDYVIEISNYKNVPGTIGKIAELKYALSIYNTAALKDRAIKEIKGVMITYLSSTTTLPPEPKIFYLKYNSEKESFDNLSELKTWIG